MNYWYYNLIVPKNHIRIVIFKLFKEEIVV